VSDTYDAAGNRTSMSIPGRGTISYSYDAANQLTTLTDWANHVFSFTYAPDDMPASITRPGNVATYYGYDGADRLTSIHHDTSSGAIAHYDYTLDANGNRTSMTSAAGTENYTLDALNRLTNVSYPNGDSASYTYDAAGNRLSTTLNGSTTKYTYDSAGRLVSQGDKAITYDAAGNTFSIGSDTYTWDWAGRLSTSNVGGLTSKYTYDGDGVRVGQTIAGSTTNYTWDRNRSLPLLVDDGMQGYVQTDQGVLEQQGSTTSYPLPDALGSVRTEETPTPSALSTTSYDVFGSVRSQSGQQSIFGFTGQQTDSTGLSFLRARYYNPGLGRFLSPDGVQPNGPGTQGYDLYSYVANNPTSAVDPNGNVTAVETGLGLVARVLRAIPGGVALGNFAVRAYLAVQVAFQIALENCAERIILCIETIGAAYKIAEGLRDLTGLGPSPRAVPVSGPIIGGPIPHVDAPPAPQTNIDDSVRECIKSGRLSAVAFQPQDPCGISGISIYFSGIEIKNTTAHIQSAILTDRPALLHRRDVSTINRPSDLRSRCDGIMSDEWCDEYPFFSSVENRTADVSYKAVPRNEQSVTWGDSQANSLRSFYSAGVCNVPKAGGEFIVIPQSYARTFFICSDGRVYLWQ
jgi:RHS repeat-associated protein